MINNFQDLDKAFENKVRLAIMSILMVEDQISFNELKSTLKVTDGNLASHIKALEKIGYLSVIKSFVGKKPHTVYTANKVGVKAFKKHLAALEQILNSMK